MPTAEPGLVIHFNYLWDREARAGRENARYARPCAIVVVSTRMTPNGPMVMVSPITHSPPNAETDAMEIPAAVKRILGLDDERSWVILDEVNVFAWPGHDLDHNRRGRIDYGYLPPSMLARMKARLLQRAKIRSVATVRR